MLASLKAWPEQRRAGLIENSSQGAVLVSRAVVIEAPQTVGLKTKETYCPTVLGSQSPEIKVFAGPHFLNSTGQKALASASCWNSRFTNNACPLSSESCLLLSPRFILSLECCCLCVSTLLTRTLILLDSTSSNLLTSAKTLFSSKVSFCGNREWENINIFLCVTHNLTCNRDQTYPPSSNIHPAHCITTHQYHVYVWQVSYVLFLTVERNSLLPSGKTKPKFFQADVNKLMSCYQGQSLPSTLALISHRGHLRSYLFF